MYKLNQLASLFYFLIEERPFLLPEHSVAIWTYTFHKISGFVRVILKANFKPTYRPNPSHFFVWKFRSIILIFSYFFAEFVKSTVFYTLLLLFQRVDKFCKRRSKMSTIDLNFQSKKNDGFGL